jgi:hypothetical protein
MRRAVMLTVTAGLVIGRVEVAIWATDELKAAAKRQAQD